MVWQSAAPRPEPPTRRSSCSEKSDGTKGFFRSTDQGQHWVRINDDAHQYGSPYVIEGDPRVFGRVYVGASGRGIVVGEPLAAAPGADAAKQ